MSNDTVSITLTREQAEQVQSLLLALGGPAITQTEAPTGLRRNAAGRLVDEKGRFVKEGDTPKKKATKKKATKGTSKTTKKATNKKATKKAKVDNKALAAHIREAGGQPGGRTWSVAKSLVTDHGATLQDAAKQAVNATA